MIDWSQLLLPALYSAVAVFILSSLIHTAFKWHTPDYKALANEDEVRAAIRKSGPGPGQYMIPYCKDGGKQSPEAVQKFVEGPVGLLVLRPSGPIQMGGFLGKWFVYCFVVALVSGYVAHFTLPPSRTYMDVFRLVGTVSWLAFAWAGPSDAIWMGKPWGSTLKFMFDGLLYALLTAGCFAWQLHTGA
ncbi:MAG: hypothetical protein IPJ19_12090 [Planctomycetes bacterium]|nr:hypothetical protein [Planctomycetota bacterium]